MENTQNAEEIDLLELLRALKKRVLLIILVGLAFGCFSSVYTGLFVEPVYTSTATMLVLTGETTISSLTDLQIGTQLTNDYSVLITSRPVLQDVVDNLDLDMDYKDLRENVTVANPDDTRILQLSVDSNDAEQAKQIADELAAVSSDYIGDQMEVVPPKIIEEGEIPTTRTSPSMIRAALLGLLLGVALSGGVICVMTILDDTIKSEDDIAEYLGISVLSSVPDRKDYINSRKVRDKHGSPRGEHTEAEEERQDTRETHAGEIRSRERRERRSS